MRTFLKLNFISALYGILFTIPYIISLYLFVIARISGLNFDLISVIFLLIFAILYVAAIFGFYFLTKKWMEGNPVRFWSVILWFPYFMLFTLIADGLLPEISEQDKLSGGGGFIILAFMLFYPIYILFVNIFVIKD